MGSGVFAPAAYGKNSKILPQRALVDGQVELHPEGKYHLAISRAASRSSSPSVPTQIQPLLPSCERNIHLRPKEIERSLLDIYALIAVCLETGRPLEEAMKIRVSNAGNGSDCSFIPARDREDLFHWSWRTIEPVYARNTGL